MNKKLKLKSQKSKQKTKKIKLLFLVLSFTFCVFTFDFFCYAQAVSSNELIDNAKIYDGKEIVYQGEVIGEVMPRGSFAWVNVNDGSNAIGLWISKALAAQIKHGGSYTVRGDKIRVKGIFYRSCLEHGGDLDIHVLELSLVSLGKITGEEINLKKVDLAIILALACILVFILKCFGIKKGQLIK